MTKHNNLEQAFSLLESMKVPERQRNQMCCLVLLAMADLMPGTKWSCAQNNWKRIHDIITFVDKHCIAAPDLRNKPWINEKLSAQPAGNLPPIGKPSAEGLPDN